MNEYKNKIEKERIPNVDFTHICASNSIKKEEIEENLIDSEITLKHTLNAMNNLFYANSFSLCVISIAIFHWKKNRRRHCNGASRNKCFYWILLFFSFHLFLFFHFSSWFCDSNSSNGFFFTFGECFLIASRVLQYD